MAKNTSGILACITGRDAETGLFLSHCLNFDLMESGPTEEVAWERLKAAMKAQIEHCYTNYRPGLEVTASREEWDEFARLLKDNKESLEVEQIQIDLKPPLVEPSSSEPSLSGFRGFPMSTQPLTFKELRERMQMCGVDFSSPYANTPGRSCRRTTSNSRSYELRDAEL